MRAQPFARRGQRAFQQALRGELGLSGEILERHKRYSVSSLLRRSMLCRRFCCNASFWGHGTEWAAAASAHGALGLNGGGARRLRSPRVQLRKLFLILCSAACSFSSLTTAGRLRATSADAADLLVPVPHFCRGAGRVLRLGGTGEGGGWASVRRMAGRRRPADRRAGGERSEIARRGRNPHPRRGPGVVFRLERDRGAAGGLDRAYGWWKATVVASEDCRCCWWWWARSRCWRSPSWSCSGRSSWTDFGPAPWLAKAHQFLTFARLVVAASMLATCCCSPTSFCRLIGQFVDFLPALR